MNYCIIVNPNAGKKQGGSIAEDVSAELKNSGHKTEILVSDAPGGTRVLASSLEVSRYDAVLAVGGDGTLFEVINGLFENNPDLPIPVGQIPVGTGNSFLKDLEISTVDDAVKAILAGRTRAVDLGEFEYEGGRYFFANLLGAGFVSNVAYRARKYKKLGALSYIFGVLEELIVLKSTDVEFNIDGQVFHRDAIFVEICNSRFTGGDMMMAPDAKIDDGLFDIVVLNRITRFRILKIFPLIFKGSHVKNPAVEVFRGRKISIRSDLPLALTPDGETFGSTPIQVSMHEGKIRMFG